MKRTEQITWSNVLISRIKQATRHTIANAKITEAIGIIDLSNWVRKDA